MGKYRFTLKMYQNVQNLLYLRQQNALEDLRSRSSLELVWQLWYNQLRKVDSLYLRVGVIGVVSVVFLRLWLARLVGVRRVVRRHHGPAVVIVVVVVPHLSFSHHSHHKQLYHNRTTLTGETYRNCLIDIIGVLLINSNLRR